MRKVPNEPFEFFDVISGVTTVFTANRFSLVMEGASGRLDSMVTNTDKSRLKAYKDRGESITINVKKLERWMKEAQRGEEDRLKNSQFWSKLEDPILFHKLVKETFPSVKDPSRATHMDVLLHQPQTIILHEVCYRQA